MRHHSRILLSAGLTGLCLIALLLLVWNTRQNINHMAHHENRLLLSTSLIKNPAIDLNNICDKDPQTALSGINHIDQQSSWPNPTQNDETQSRQWPFRLRWPFIQMDVALTHLPGEPPRINPLQAIEIWNGNQKSPTSFANFARARKIKAVFFRQRLVDSDREYRLIGSPKHWQSFDLVLQDKLGAQRFDLKFREPIFPSEPFPGQIDLIWCRIEIHSYWPGNIPATKNNIAISEVQFQFKNPWRRTISLDTTPGKHQDYTLAPNLIPSSSLIKKHSRQIANQGPGEPEQINLTQK